MKKHKLKTGNTYQGTQGKIKLIDDVLPPPEQLVLREPTTEKITLTLDSSTIDFFKTQAKKLKAPYQRMIRNLLREYAERVGRGE